MKGIVFTEFLELVESKFGLDVADRIIRASKLASGGSYTAVGTYDHDELLQLVTNLSTTTGVAIPELVRTFGIHLFGRFVASYPQFFRGVRSTFAFLSSIESIIHVEVRKLYPDAELPRFESTIHDARHMELIYRSSRPFADLAEGLIIGCAAHFGEKIEIRREPLVAEPGHAFRYLLTVATGEPRWTTPVS